MGYISPIVMTVIAPSFRIVDALRRAGSIAEIARVAKLPKRSLQSVLEGSVPSVDRADEICRALGISLTIGASSPPLRSWNDPPFFQIDHLSDETLVVDEARQIDPELLSVVHDLAEAWKAIPAADRAWLRTSLELLRSRVPAAPTRRAGRPAGDGG